MALGGFARRECDRPLAALMDVSARPPFRHMVTPGGWLMSVAMTKCRRPGRVPDRTGYRHDRN